MGTGEGGRKTQCGTIKGWHFDTFKALDMSSLFNPLSSPRSFLRKVRICGEE